MMFVVDYTNMVST